MTLISGKFISEYTNQLENTLPCLYFYYYIAPKIFSILFALIKPLLSPVTLAKIKIYGSNSSKWKLALLNNIPADQIPVNYGGTAAANANVSIHESCCSILDPGLLNS